jgi:hypothetical protein
MHNMTMHPKIIRDTLKIHQSEKKVVDGIMSSAMIPDIQREAIGGLIKSALPAGVAGKREPKEAKPMLFDARAPATHTAPGHRRLPHGGKAY